MLVLFSISAFAGDAVPIDGAKLGQVIAPASLVGLDCKREGLQKPMTCVTGADDLAGGVRTEGRAVLHPKNGLTLVELQVGIFELPEGKRDATRAWQAMYMSRAAIVNGMTESAGYTIGAIDAEGWLVLTHPSEMGVRCAALVDGSTVPTGIFADSAVVTCKVDDRD